MAIEAKERDFPSDGHHPINPKTGAIHQGGLEDTQLPILSPPDEVPVGAPIQNRKTIHNLSPTAEEILDPETGEIDTEKLHHHIDNALSAWGPEGDPERDEYLAQARARINDAIAGLMAKEEEEGLDGADDARLSTLERAAAEVQAMLRKKNPEFADAPGKIVPKSKKNAGIDPHADTEIENIFARKEKALEDDKTEQSLTPVHKKTRSRHPFGVKKKGGNLK